MDQGQTLTLVSKKWKLMELDLDEQTGYSGVNKEN